ncbi:Structural maintenance of chromosomes protein 4 [Acorus gramineus]|uniref:Structural maintenance of chromosomes protein 4 n=1 Tax=Acorus gramineus TaxID=55184 RepID=A0AAV9B3Z5_ACOGR|nr:Structural maintenance of chromosomes protein 4 [Acorus gramineus]
MVGKGLYFIYNMEADAEKRTPRLFIKEMVMSNFKSYAAEQRVGPLPQSFSVVVGPNGSGKSNVIDAMLFGLGKRAKQEKQTDLLRKMKEKVNTPEGVPRLFDLVRVDNERLKLAFFSVLGNTIVAQDLDQATRIAYGGDKEFRRVVTLDGALFEKSEVAELVEQLSNLRQRIADAQKHYQASESAARQLEMDLAKGQKEIDNLKAQYREIEQKLYTLRNDSQPKAEELARVKELEKVIALEEKEMERLTKCSKKLKDKASELQNKIESAGGEKLKSQKLKVTQIQSLVNKYKEVLDEAKSEYNKVDAEYKLQDMKKLLKEWEMKGKGFKKRLDDIQRDLTKHMEQIKKDAVDPEKIKVTLAGKTLHEACELQRAVEMVALFEAQLKELNPNLDSITEYTFVVCKSNAYIGRRLLYMMNT